MLTKDMTRAPGQMESFLLSWTCSYQNPFRLCLPSCVSAPLSQTRLLCIVEGWSLFFCFLSSLVFSQGKRGFSVVFVFSSSLTALPPRGQVRSTAPWEVGFGAGVEVSDRSIRRR